MKKTISLILLITILLAFAPIVNAETTASENVTLTVDKPTAHIGDTITVTLKTVQKIQSTDFSINYSSNILEFVSSSINSEHYNASNEGKIIFCYYNFDGEKIEEFDTLTFTFKTKAIGNATVSTDIEKLFIDTSDNNVLAFENKSVDITVNPIEVTSITLDKTSTNIEVGNELELVATVLPEEATDKNVTWATSNEHIATVENGIVTGIKAGTVIITATAGKVSANCEIKVTEKDVDYIKNEKLSLIQGDDLTMLTGIDEETTIEQLLTDTNFTNNYIVKAYKNDTEITTGKVTTGTVIKFFNEEELVKEFTVVIYGDTTGNGIIESVDALAIVKNNLKHVMFSNEVYLEAGRVTKSKRGTDYIPTAVDALACVKHNIEVAPIEQKHELNIQYEYVEDHPLDGNGSYVKVLIDDPNGIKSAEAILNVNGKEYVQDLLKTSIESEMNSEIKIESYAKINIEDLNTKKQETTEGETLKDIIKVKVIVTNNIVITRISSWEHILTSEQLTNEVYAKLYDDGTLAFTNTNRVLDGKTVIKQYGDLNTFGHTSIIEGTPIWGVEADKITKVDFVDEVFPNKTTSWFAYCTDIESINNINNLNTSNVTDMSNMFRGCYSLEKLDLSNFDTSNVTDMSGMFRDCENYLSKLPEPSELPVETSGLKELNISNFDTSNVTNMSYMFDRCTTLTELDLSNFDTSSVTNISNMFAGCSSLTKLDVSNFDTSNVTDMSGMFRDCVNLDSLDVSNFNTSKVINMFGMFSGCSGITNLDISGFDTSNVTDMTYMFAYTIFENLDLSNFNTSKVNNMSYMFRDCANLVNLDLSSFDTSNVNNMNFMFYGCKNLPSLDLSSFDTSKVTTMHDMFENCTKLENIYVSDKWTTENADTKYMFLNCGTDKVTVK